MSKKTTKIPKAICEGPLTIGDITLDCAVLDNGSRVITERKFMSSMGIKRSGYQAAKRKETPLEGGAVLPLFVASPALKPYIGKHLDPVLKRTQQFVTLEG